MNIVPKNVLKYRSQKSMMKYEGAPSFTATRWTRPGTSARRFFFELPELAFPFIEYSFYWDERGDGFRTVFEQLADHPPAAVPHSNSFIDGDAPHGAAAHKSSTHTNTGAPRYRIPGKGKKILIQLFFFCFLYPATSLSSFSIYAVVLGGRFAMDTTFQKRRSRIKFEKIIKPLSSLHLYLSCADRGCNHGKIKTIFQALPYSEIQVPSWIPRHQNKWEFTRFCYDHTETLFPALPYLGKK